MTDDSVEWSRLAGLARSILTCPDCIRWSSTKPPEPFWVGPGYKPGGIVLLARNPADKGGRPLPPDALKLLDELAKSGSTDDFRAWSEWRRRDMQRRWSDGRPWDQWARAFAPATRGAASVNELAWLNVLPARTAGNAKPSAQQLLHGENAHLRPVLEELEPSDIVWRYADAQKAVVRLKDSLRGNWRTDLGMNGLAVSRNDRDRVNTALRSRTAP